MTSLLSHFPRRLWLLLGAHFLASFVHFAHNAEYIAFYPNMPAWLSREKVYLAWLSITGVGLLAILASRTRFKLLGLLLLGVYGALGLDGLAHYTLALCSEHTLATNITIASEVLTGLALLLVSAALLGRQLSTRLVPRPAR